MPEISDISENEIWVVKSTLQERYDFDVELQIADSEIRLRPSDRTMTECPIFYWEVDDCHFVIIKAGDRKYRCMFYYRLYQQNGTGIPEYDNLTECVVSLLQVQSDYAAKERGDL